jgi:hypothetical protein
MDNAVTPTVLGIEIDVARSVTARRSNVVPNLMPEIPTGHEKSCRQRIRVRHGLDMHGPSSPAIAFGVGPRRSLGRAICWLGRCGPPRRPHLHRHGWLGAAQACADQVSTAPQRPFMNSILPTHRQVLAHFGWTADVVPRRVRCPGAPLHLNEQELRRARTRLAAGAGTRT